MSIAAASDAAIVKATVIIAFIPVVTVLSVVNDAITAVA